MCTIPLSNPKKTEVKQKLNKRSLNTKNVFNIPVWYNSNIKIACKYVIIKDWYMKGVKIIGDFLNEK